MKMKITFLVLLALGLLWLLAATGCTQQRQPMTQDQRDFAAVLAFVTLSVPPAVTLALTDPDRTPEPPAPVGTIPKSGRLR